MTVAVTRRGDAHDLPATRPDVMFLSPRHELRGWGEALRIEVPAPWPDHLGVVDAALATISGDRDGGGTAGSEPVAFAALPFDRAAAATFVVPELVVDSTTPVLSSSRNASAFRDEDRTGGGRDGLGGVGLGGVGGELGVAATMAPDDWCDLVAEATKRIAAGDLHKVVLARELLVAAEGPIDPHAIAERLAAAHPHAYRYDVDGFVGASPELLVSRFGDVVRAHPMAGTTPRSGDPDADRRRAAELLASHKNRAEHQITIDMVLDTLLAFTSYVDAEPEPSVVAAGSVQHLATMVEGRLSEPAASVLELVGALHPTPAVGGHPRDAALALIAELEPHGRGCYAGPVGWVDATGNGAWAVGLRGAQVEGATARLHAGVGVVADSDPAAELAETEAKFAATLGPIVGHYS